MKRKTIVILAVLSFLCILSGLMSNKPEVPNGTKTFIDGTKTDIIAPKVVNTPGETQATKVKNIGLTMLDKPIADLLTATESIVIKDQEEAKTATGKIRITYKYKDDSSLTIVCTTTSNGLLIYSIME